MKIIEGGHYYVMNIPDDKVLNMGIGLDYYPRDQIVEAVGVEVIDPDWCSILCPNGMTWEIKRKYLRANCIWEAE